MREPGSPLLSQVIEEPPDGGLIPAGGRPDEPAGVVVDHHHQVAVALAMRDLVDADAGEALQGIAAAAGLGSHTGHDGPHGPPGDAHQLRHRRARRLAGEPGHLVLEVLGEPRGVACPRQGHHDHPVSPASDPGCVGLEEARCRAQIEATPAPPPLPVVKPRAAPPADPAPPSLVGEGADRHDDRGLDGLALVSGHPPLVEADVLDARPVDTKDASP